MAINIKYRQLKAFLLAIDAGSFTLAASKLGVTQPSFTTIIQDLENILGLKLFERTTRTIHLTQAGEDFRARISRPLADLEEAYRYAEDLAEVRLGRVVVGALPSCAMALLPDTIALLRKTSPGLTIRVAEAHNDDLINMVRTNQIEFALATAPVGTADLVSLPLTEDWFCVVFPQNHPLARKTRITWEDTHPFDLILLSKGSSARARFASSLPPEALDGGALRYDVTHMGTALGMVHRGLGITFLPRIALSELPLDGLKAHILDDPTAQRTISIIHRVDRSLSPAAQALCDALRLTASRLDSTQSPQVPPAQESSPTTTA